MKLVRILLPIDQGGTSPACVKAALTLAKQFSAELEVLHPCLAAWQRLPYATELSPYYFQELINTGSEQVAFEKGEAKTWCDKAVRSAGVAIEFCSIEGLIGPTVAMRARVSDFTVLAHHRGLAILFLGDRARCGAVRFRQAHACGAGRRVGCVW